jgi:cold shock CspA family protein
LRTIPRGKRAKADGDSAAAEASRHFSRGGSGTIAGRHHGPCATPDFCHHSMAFINPKGETTAAVGTVKWFNAKEGYGFIQPDTGGKDRTCSSISPAVERAGLSSLNEGDKVKLRSDGQPRERISREPQGRLIALRGAIRRLILGVACLNGTGAGPIAYRYYGCGSLGRNS